MPSGVADVGLFGWNLVSSEDQILVLTEGEFDAMAVHQATGMLAVSLPNGANNLPIALLPQLQKFKRIYLWMDADEAGVQGAKRFAEKLGINRTYIVNTRKKDLQNGPKDANEALLRGYNLTQFIEEAKPLVEDDIIRFSDIKTEVLKRLIHKDEHVGISSSTFSWFNKKMKGLRRGELTILTGPTGCGKTTFLSQYSLDFLTQGVPTLWGSFEVKNEILASHMLQQFMPRGADSPDQFETYAGDFQELPLYFLKYFGSTQIDSLISSLEFAVYQYDISSIIIDNLQFLLSGQGRSNFDRFQLQDYAIGRLRKFASENNIHLTLVIHPKKVDDDQELTVASVFGSAKATQEADNILIFQNKQKFRFLDIRKNRFDGDIGRVPLGFDRKSKRFFELTEQELALLVRENFPIRSIIQRRLRQFNGMLSPKTNQSHQENKVKVTQQQVTLLRKPEKENKQLRSSSVGVQSPSRIPPLKQEIKEPGGGILQFEKQLSQFADEYLANKEKRENQQGDPTESDSELREMFEPDCQLQEAGDLLFTNPVWNDQISLITGFHTHESKQKLEKVMKYEKLRDERRSYIEQLQKQEEFLYDPNSFAKMGVPKKEIEALHQIIAAEEVDSTNITEYGRDPTTEDK